MRPSPARVRISGMGLATALLGCFLAVAADAKQVKPLWKQISGVASETVFLRRGPGPLMPVAGMPTMTSGDLLHTRPFLHTEHASMTIFVRNGTGDSMELYPGSVLALDGDAVRLDLGRLKLIASGGAGLMVDIRRGVVELPEGELLIETDPKGGVTLALRRGTGWIKMDDRMIRKLSPGKQYTIPKYGIPGKPTEVAQMWKRPPGFWIMPQPPEPPPVVYSDADVASDTDAPAIASDASEAVVSTDTASITASLASGTPETPAATETGQLASEPSLPAE